MSKSSRSHGPTLNRRELLRLSTAAAGIAAVMPSSGAFGDVKDGQAGVAPGTCSTPRSAVATTQYGKVRGYVEDGVLTFKGVPYGASTGGPNRWLPAKPPTSWNGEYLLPSGLWRAGSAGRWRGVSQRLNVRSKPLTNASAPSTTTSFWWCEAPVG